MYLEMAMPEELFLRSYVGWMAPGDRYILHVTEGRRGVIRIAVTAEGVGGLTRYFATVVWSDINGETGKRLSGPSIHLLRTEIYSEVRRLLERAGMVEVISPDFSKEEP